jgi:DNA-directed RNA polymerase specialized sigma24 family protein
MRAKANPHSSSIDIEDPKQLQDLAIRVRAFAQARSKVYTWWLRPVGALARGNTLDDVVATAVASLFGAKRSWNPNTEPDPFEYLKSVVNSELWKLARSAENRRTSRLTDGQEYESDDTPLTRLVEAEVDAQLQRRRDRFYSLLVEAICDRPDLVELHDLIVNNGTDKPQEIAAQLGISVGDANNLKKRFMTACNKVGVIIRSEEASNE